jgi:uncharacterized protein (DUF433 family)
MSPLPEIFDRDPTGEIRFKGHRLRLIDVAARYDERHSPEAIVVDFYPTLTLAQVYRAIAYYLENQAEVGELIAKNERMVEDLKMHASAAPSFAELRKRLEAKRRAEAS